MSGVSGEIGGEIGALEVLIPDFDGIERPGEVRLKLSRIGSSGEIRLPLLPIQAGAIAPPEAVREGGE